MKTIAEIEEIRKNKREELDLRVNENSDSKEKHILVCKGTGCTSSKSPKIIETLRNLLEEKGITGSMSRPGCPYDNACVESFFASLKKEKIYRRKDETMEEVRKDVFWYIEMFYNRKRRRCRRCNKKF